MTPNQLEQLLSEQFGSHLTCPAPGNFQVDSPEYRLLVLLSEDQGWLRLLLPVAPEAEARPFLADLLAANFDATQMVRYALHEQVLWLVFQHGLADLSPTDFQAAIALCLDLHRQGLDLYFNALIERQIRQIIQASKRQGKTLDDTLQTLSHFYAEGMMGDLNQSSDRRAATLEAWRYQLERLWPSID